MCEFLNDSDDDKLDYQQDIARANFGDMLHDWERNQKYFRAIKIAVELKHARAEKAMVLDIGTGTGLLSMMAAYCGADEIVACEGFKPMASCAARIIERNGFGDKIRVVAKRSTELTVGAGKDLHTKANILVTEVFDTDLIGEDAIFTYRHAHKYLLTDDCIAIPDRAIIYVQIVESPFAWNWNKPKLLANLDGDILLKPPPSISASKGNTVSHDIQMSQLPLSSFNALTDPIPVLTFDFSGKTELPKTRTVQKSIKSSSSGLAQAIFVWWDLSMDTNAEVVLSCAPYWAHPDLQSVAMDKKSFREIPWRDHWMQAIYYIPSPFQLETHEEFQLTTSHNEYILWFEVSKNQEPIKTILPEPALCDSEFYAINSRTRIGQLNDHQRNKKFIKYMEDHLASGDIVLAIGDGSLLCLAAATLGINHLYILQENKIHRSLINEYIQHNNLKNVTVLRSLEELDSFAQITQIIVEPHFTNSILPWENFRFGNYLEKIKPSLNATVRHCPLKAKIYAVPVEFVDLQKIRQSLENCEGFDMSIFDELIKFAQDSADETIEAQPLWEYPCKAVGQPVELLEIDFMEYAKNIQRKIQLNFNVVGKCNGIALWVDWLLDGKVSSPRGTVSTGPTAEIQFDDYIKWDVYTRQGVELFDRNYNVTHENYIACDLDYSYDNCKLKCNFKIK